MKRPRRRWFVPRRASAPRRNQVTLLQSGAEFIPALLAAIASARTEVWLETYIFADDEAGWAVAEALAAAALRGVEVRVMIDGYGTRPLAPALSQRLGACGVALRVYSPVRRLLTLDRSRLRRLHRKQAVIDGRVAFVGGINILDDFQDPNHGRLAHPRLDYAVQVCGPLVEEVRLAMERLWNRALLTDLPRLGRISHEPHAPPTREEGGVWALLLLRDNLLYRRSIERAYLKAIGTARREVLIANAYFFPGRKFRRALKAAAARGVRVRLLLQGRIEYLIPHLAAQALYGELLGSGIEIVEYRRSFLHAKVAVIDDWATVGSSNIDPFSLLLSRESNVVVIDRDFAAQLRSRLLESMQQGGEVLARERHERRPWHERLLIAIAYRLMRLAVAVSGATRRY